MKSNNLILSLIGSTLLVPSIFAQEILVAAWEFSNLPGAITQNTIYANVSDLYPGDGEATDGAAGTFYADGNFGSDNIDASASLTFGRAQGNASFNSDVITISRPFPNDLDANIDGAAGMFLIADGTFGAGGAADPSGKNVVFAAYLPEGKIFKNTIKFSSAAGNTSGTTTSLNLQLSYSYNGTDYTDAGTFSITQFDALGPQLTLNDATGESQVFIRIQLPTLGFSNITFDNIQFVSELSTDDENASFWANSPVTNNWKNTGLGYDNEPGIGWIYDSNWPWIYSYSMGATPGWFYVNSSGDRNNFFAYNASLGFWIYGKNAWGWYYSYESGNEGWYPFIQNTF